MHEPAVNPFFSGNFAPVHTEDDFADLPVVGSLPKELSGTYYRTGPNPQFSPRDKNTHWFDGDGMAHAFFVENGKVRYRNRYTHTPKWVLEKAAGRSLFGTFGDPRTTDPSVLDKRYGIANTNILVHAGRLIALDEGNQPFEMHRASLESLGYLSYAKTTNRFTAHPKIDPETGEMVFFGYHVEGVGSFDFLSYGVVDRHGEVTRLDIFKAPYSSMVHDFFVTQNYVMFPVLPLTFNMERAVSGKPLWAWEPEKGAFVGVMHRKADVSTMQWFETDPCYMFHPMNMWEEGDKIHVDVMEYETAPLFPNADGSPGKPAAATLARWTLDLRTKTRVKRQQIDDSFGEFPRVDERFAGLPYRHGYYAVDTHKTYAPIFNALAHIDFKTGQKRLYTLPNGDTVGEAVFVPRSKNAPEGEGWLVALAYRGAEDRSELMVLEAQDITSGPIARVLMPRRIPYGFHGNWVAAS